MEGEGWVSGGRGVGGLGQRVSEGWCSLGDGVSAGVVGWE